MSPEDTDTIRSAAAAPLGTYAVLTDRHRLIVGTEALHTLGPRVLCEFLLEAASDDIPELLRRLDDYARLSPEVSRALGANDWTAPIRRAIPARRAA